MSHFMKNASMTHILLITYAIYISNDCKFYFRFSDAKIFEIRPRKIFKSIFHQNYLFQRRFGKDNFGNSIFSDSFVRFAFFHTCFVENKVAKQRCTNENLQNETVQNETRKAKLAMIWQ